MLNHGPDLSEKTES